VLQARLFLRAIKLSSYDHERHNPKLENDLSLVLMNAWILLFAVLLQVARLSAETVTVASYNIKFLNSGVQEQGNRLEKLRAVISLLNADAIGLQEIRDRAALELLFPPADWVIVIDDSSGDDQDVAVVARKRSLTVLSHRFLFEGSANDSFFPSRRDLLCVEFGVNGTTETFSLMVHHAKARVGGRANTDARREGASRKIVELIQQEFEDKSFIILGDFNDNPDDRSLNILETGNPNAPGGPEEIDGPLMINLMDRLCAEGHVSHGRRASDVIGDRINTVDPRSRDRNNEARGSIRNTGDILFDQILFPVWMVNKYVGGSAKVFDHAVAVLGSGDNVASDHLPVLAEFEFVTVEPEPVPTSGGLEIVALLPNPNGPDEGNEEVTIANFSNAEADLSRLFLVDKAGNTYNLTGVIPPQSRLVVRLERNTMPLNNTGDEVTLAVIGGGKIHSVSYTASDARSGNRIQFR
jgi:endonuclease/exonuclease/phosphatase family metal-dependent hydrolase